MSNTNMNVPCSKVNSGSITVGTSRVQLPSNPKAIWIQFMHVNSTADVYIGGETVTTANGFGALQYKDTTERYPVFDTNQFFAIASEAGVELRYLWGE